ncbi:MAG: hypothetical protein H0X37_25210 [Herpetosiphonaceae bacterium]|nr:hypothetical protein [Herpetosiphonaceae bacterium]
MTNTIVSTEAEAVNPITAEAVDALKAAWDAAVATQNDAYHASITHPQSLRAVRDLKAALDAETIAHAAWKAGEAALQAQWRQEDAYDEAMCAKFDALDNAIDYPEHYDASMPIPYQITSYGHTYLDHHYATHSNADMLAEGGESPYGDGTTGYVQPAPVPNYVHDGITDCYFSR